MAAPTNAANVKKALANSEPSTHGTQLPSADAASCPHLADADIRVLNEESGFDPDSDIDHASTPWLEATRPFQSVYSRPLRCLGWDT